MPISTCRLTMSATERWTIVCAASSSSLPLSRRSRSSTTASVLGRLPTCVVRTGLQDTLLAELRLCGLCSHAQRENGFLAQLGPEAGGESAEPLLRDDPAVPR